METVQIAKPSIVKTVTFGCKVNQADTAAMEYALSQATGAAINRSENAPDLIIVNTCTVTAAADRQARQLIRRMHRL
ncbi:MAG: hypothetical protein KDD48_05345, partial [Bdellovibrionales bacterium]|nr:hypothetical protein [Bdellovibrionales bacterium]